MRPAREVKSRKSGRLVRSGLPGLRGLADRCNWAAPLEEVRRSIRRRGDGTWLAYSAATLLLDLVVTIDIVHHCPPLSTISHHLPTDPTYHPFGPLEAIRLPSLPTPSPNSLVWSATGIRLQAEPMPALLRPRRPDDPTPPRVSNLGRAGPRRHRRPSKRARR